MKKGGHYIINYPEYNGPGIYELVSDDGKRYIGQSRHIRLRIIKHESFAKMGKENKLLQEAMDSGKRFTANVLMKFDENVSDMELYYAEREAVKQAYRAGQSLNSFELIYIMSRKEYSDFYKSLYMNKQEA